jgi:hypothetical protein
MRDRRAVGLNESSSGPSRVFPVSNRAGIVGTAALEELVPLTQDTDGIAKLDAARLAIGRAHRQWRRM